MATGKKLFTAVFIWILVLFGTLALILVYSNIQFLLYFPIFFCIILNNLFWLFDWFFGQNRLNDSGVSSDRKVITSDLPHKVHTITHFHSFFLTFEKKNWFFFFFLGLGLYWFLVGLYSFTTMLCIIFKYFKIGYINNLVEYMWKWMVDALTWNIKIVFFLMISLL